MKIQRIYSPENEMSNALNAAADKQCTRVVKASFYADCLCCGGGIDWAKLNAAIVARWPKGLRYIKELAWKEYRATVALCDAVTK